MMLLFSWQLSVSAKRTAQFALHYPRTTAVFQQLERKESEIHGKYQNQDVYLSRQTLREKTSKNVLLYKWRKLICTIQYDKVASNVHIQKFFSTLRHLLNELATVLKYIHAYKNFQIFFNCVCFIFNSNKFFYFIVEI